LPALVYDDIALGNILGSHLTPSYFFVNPQGLIKEQLVTFKTAEAIQFRIENLLKVN
jgi:hypothetical protein